MSTYTPTDNLSPEAKQLLANIARRQLRQSLRAAHDSADLLVELSDNTADHDRAIAFFVEIGHVLAKADQQLRDR